METGEPSEYSQGLIVFLDIEAGIDDHRVHDIGAVRSDGATLHTASRSELLEFLRGADFVCGHNVVHHDALLVADILAQLGSEAREEGRTGAFGFFRFGRGSQASQRGGGRRRPRLVDTLYVSPLLFPKRPYHRLVKDDKLQTDEVNNPVNDCLKARDLLYDELNAFRLLGAEEGGRLFELGVKDDDGGVGQPANPQAVHVGHELQQIYGRLLASREEFCGFFDLAGFEPDDDRRRLSDRIARCFEGRLCAHADIASLVDACPCELAYALALISTDDVQSATPSWVLYNFPKVEEVLRLLRNTPCAEGCAYCHEKLDARRQLSHFFGYDEFRRFDGENLQEEAVRAAVAGESMLVIFPTGGGKSLTFQLPALMAGEAVHGLTVVISPLQSLMKDQVDNLAERGISSAVTINGLMDPISRADAVQRVAEGSASLLYISPEMLRSRTIQHLLQHRNVVRFVIDEAHCFSAWGQDFRVDYLYIGEFIASLAEHYQQRAAGEALGAPPFGEVSRVGDDKVGGLMDEPAAPPNLRKPFIPVSCFTATAKQKVISDICDYFQHTLGLQLRLFASSSSRKNLHYSVIHVDSDEDKYIHLRQLIGEETGPTIVYVSRTRRTIELSQRLSRDGFPALPFNGKMEASQKVQNQNAFMTGEVRIIVATSAFGMGVDKKDVGLVVHYDISDSLENYVQEAGRAGRDPSMTARCFVLYGDQDLDKHFVLLNQTKLSMNEIQQVWKAVKDLTKQRPTISCSALEIARQAGWDNSVSDIETRVRTAVATLEQAGYLKRGNNIPHVYATGIMVKNMDEARQRLMLSPLFDDADRQNAIRVVKSLITSRQVGRAQDDEAESRIDYLADILGLTKETVISTVQRMRKEGILADSRDMVAYLQDAEKNSSRKRSTLTLDHFLRLERFLYDAISQGSCPTTLRQLNDLAVQQGVPAASVKNLRTLLFFLSIKGYLNRLALADQGNITLTFILSPSVIQQRFQLRESLSRFILGRLHTLAEQQHDEKPGSEQGQNQTRMITFSVIEMLTSYQQHTAQTLFANHSVTITDVEEALLYLSKIGALKLEGGFLVLYNAIEIRRIKDSRLRYKVEDYRLLDQFYKQKVQQVHIVGEYANLMVRDYDAALRYVQDYFQLDHKHFISKYFKGERATQISKNITPAKYQQLFGQLSRPQRTIIDDKTSQYIVVAAGPGSGKTRLLVHKMASLLLLEEVKHEQLLMLTFSRAAATEFKQRLLDLIGNAAHFVEIKTFHSYCFDLLGRIGNLDAANHVVRQAAQMIEAGEVEPNRISKAVLLIDEAQDMDTHEFDLVRALMRHNDDMRLIAVGDDDQNVYQFRGADSRFMRQLVTESGAKLYQMTENFRSSLHVVSLANTFALRIPGRMKSAPISAVSTASGCVEVVQHIPTNIETPLVRHIVSLLKTNALNNGSIGVLTSTNDEAIRIAALLRHHGIRCRLIQSMDGFRLTDLAEVRYFLKYIKQRITSPVISDQLWSSAKEALAATYQRSTCLDSLRCCLSNFESVSRTKYLSDFQEFLDESSIEDFSPASREDVIVSTIHKSKGREYDTVFLSYAAKTNEYEDPAIILRQLYVAITRAKRNLYIHSVGSLFANMGVDKYTLDPVQYPLPDTITLQLTHRDLFLDYFKDKKAAVLALRSGDMLHFDCDTIFSQDGIPLARLSAKQRDEMAHWNQQGYVVTSAQVRYIVAWRPSANPLADNPPTPLSPDPQPPVAVLLPDLHLIRKK